MDADAFRSSLDATIAWCRPRFDVDHRKGTLRSHDLQPPIVIAGDHTLADIQHAVSIVVDRRALILGAPMPASVDDGRLFGFHVCNSLSDGVSEMETDGFIDGSNTPPWDSWVCMVDELLVSWVPPAMVEDVQLAIMCNAEECIAWLSDITGNPFVNQLRARQLVW